MPNTEKYIFITGANSGIGLATSKLLAASGYKIIAGVYPDIDAAEELLNSLNNTVIPLILDVTDSNSIDSVFEDISSIVKEDGLEAVINCAGIAMLMPCEAFTSQEIKKIIDTNLTGTFLTSKASLPFLRKTQGTLINIASDGGYLAMPFGSAYCASKFGVEALSDSLRAEVKKQHINVVVVEPGNIQTPIWQLAKTGLARRLESLSPELFSLYQQDFNSLIQIESSGLKVDVVANKLKKIIENKNPKTRYIIGFDARITKVVSWLPSKMRDYLTVKVIESYGKKKGLV
tara:strand:- start:1382 stop:2248 length:867 start_codon:yes stop_codon:yes gene_type:complete